MQLDSYGRNRRINIWQIVYLVNLIIYLLDLMNVRNVT